METKEVKSYLAKSSKRAAFLSLAGVLIFVSVLIFSFYFLNKQVEKAQELDQVINEKENRNRELDRELSEKQQKLATTQKVCADYQNVVEEKFPEAAEVALEQTIEKNPRSEVIIQDIKQQVPPKSNNTPITEPKKDLKTAKAKEREGFENLIGGSYGAAANAFQAAENAFPSYHNVYELARILRANQAQMAIDPIKKKEVFQTIINKYSYGAPPDLWQQVKAIANQ